MDIFRGYRLWTSSWLFTYSSSLHISSVYPDVWSETRLNRHYHLFPNCYLFKINRSLQVLFVSTDNTHFNTDIRPKNPSFYLQIDRYFVILRANVHRDSYVTHWTRKTFLFNLKIQWNVGDDIRSRTYRYDYSHLNVSQAFARIYSH